MKEKTDEKGDGEREGVSCGTPLPKGPGVWISLGLAVYHGAPTEVLLLFIITVGIFAC